MAAYRQGREVCSREMVPEGEQTSLSLQPQPEEPQLTRDTSQESHPTGETGEGQDIPGVEHIPPCQAKTDAKPRPGEPGKVSAPAAEGPASSLCPLPLRSGSACEPSWHLSGLLARGTLGRLSGITVECSFTEWV